MNKLKFLVLLTLSVNFIFAAEKSLKSKLELLNKTDLDNLKYYVDYFKINEHCYLTKRTVEYYTSRINTIIHKVEPDYNFHYKLSIKEISDILNQLLQKNETFNKYYQ